MAISRLLGLGESAPLHLHLAMVVQRSPWRSHMAPNASVRHHGNEAGDKLITLRVFPDRGNGCGKSNYTFQGIEREEDECFDKLATGEARCCLGHCQSPWGYCEAGVCHCRVGWRGFDCTEEHGTRTAQPERLPPESHGFIHVYAPPPSLGLHNALRFQCHRNSYDADYHLLRRLLLDPLARSASMSGARLFYMPTWVASSWGNVASRKYAWTTGSLVEWLTRHHRAHWLANASRHLFYYTGDLSACSVPRWGQINLVHLGLETPFDFQTRPALWQPNASATAPCAASPELRCTTSHACFERPHDVAMPFYVAWDPHAQPTPPQTDPPELVRRHRPHGGWLCELFFAGSLQHGRFSPFYAQQVAPRRPRRACPSIPLPCVPRLHQSSPHPGAGAPGCLRFACAPGGLLPVPRDELVDACAQWLVAALALLPRRSWPWLW